MELYFTRTGKEGFGEIIYKLSGKTLTEHYMDLDMIPNRPSKPELPF